MTDDGAPDRTSPSAPPSVEGLGELIREHGPRPPPTGQLFALSFPLVAIPALVVLRWSGAAAAVIATLGLGCLIVLARSRASRAKQRARTVQLHAEGLVVIDGQGARAVRFDEVDRLAVGRERAAGFLGFAVLTEPVARITTFDGTSLELRPEGIEGLSRLIDDLEGVCSEPLVPAARDALERGEPLDFGPLAFDRDEVRAGSARAPWAEIEGATVHLDRIDLRRGGRVWCTVRFEHLAHSRVVLALLPELTRVRQGAQIHIG